MFTRKAMRPLTINARFLFSALLVVFLSCATTHSEPDLPTKNIEVIVEDADTHAPIIDADVRLVSGTGTIAQRVRTNSLGRAYLPRVRALPADSYVIVRRLPYYLTGVDWDDSALEFYILMRVRPVP